MVENTQETNYIKLECAVRRGNLKVLAITLLMTFYEWQKSQPINVFKSPEERCNIFMCRYLIEPCQTD